MFLSPWRFRWSWSRDFRAVPAPPLARLALMGIWFLIVASAMGPNVIQAADPPAEPPNVAPGEPLETARVALKAWRESFVSLRLHWSLTHSDTAVYAAGLVQHTEFVWTEPGQGLLHNYTTIDGRVARRELRIWTPDRQYSLDYLEGPSKYEEPATLVVAPISAPVPDFQPLFHPACGPLYGLKDRWNRWLPEVVDRFPTRFSAATTADGIHLTCMYDMGLTATVLLDPAHACLPRKREVPNFAFTVEEFRKIEPGGVWLPWKGTYEAGVDSQHWQVEHAEVNQKIDDRIFKPPVVDGTAVIDDFEKIRYTHGKDYRGDPGTKTFERNALASAAPPDIHWSNYLVVGAAVVLVVAVVIIWIGRRS